ncbi:S8 family serine peptidase [Chloroflexota bacterium]
MDYRSIKFALIFLLIISSSIAFRVGLYSGYSSYPLRAVDINSESLFLDTSYQTGSSIASDLGYQNIQNNTHPVQPQHINANVDEVDNTIESLHHYPVLRSHDFQNQQLLDYAYQVVVAVIDTGIDAGHEALYSVVASEINFTDSPEGALDKYGHGTPIAGIIAANSDNNPGVQGIVSNCRLLNVKVVDDRGRYDMSDLVDGILWAVDNGANVINISIVSGEKSTELEMAIDYAWQNGVIIVAAAGNGGTNIPVYPAAYEHCIAVTAVDDNGNLIPLANYGDWVDIAAPGYKIYSTLPGNNYGYLYGTSFATAYISGLAATIFPLIQDSNNDGNSNDEVRQFILNNFADNPIQLIQN